MQTIDLDRLSDLVGRMEAVELKLRHLLDDGYGGNGYLLLRALTDEDFISKLEKLTKLTVPEVLELPDCEGWWWVWDGNRKSWGERYIEMKEGKPHDIGSLVRKSYCIKIQKPDFNPVTGEKL